MKQNASLSRESVVYLSDSIGLYMKRSYHATGY